jgi:hypothetical protein
MSIGTPPCRASLIDMDIGRGRIRESSVYVLSYALKSYKHAARFENLHEQLQSGQPVALRTGDDTFNLYASMGIELISPLTLPADFIKHSQSYRQLGDRINHSYDMDNESRLMLQTKRHLLKKRTKFVAVELPSTSDYKRLDQRARAYCHVVGITDGSGAEVSTSASLFMHPAAMPLATRAAMPSATVSAFTSVADSQALASTAEPSLPESESFNELLQELAQFTADFDGVANPFLTNPAWFQWHPPSTFPDA